MKNACVVVIVVIDATTIAIVNEECLMIVPWMWFSSTWEEGSSDA